MYDVIIAGAGPAGAVTAYELSRRGLKTLLLEKARLPRDKPCGGAVMYRGIRTLGGHLPMRIVQRPIRGMSFCFSQGGTATFVSEKLLGVTVDRSVFDEFLAHRAADAGAELVEAARVTSARRTNEFAEVMVSGDATFQGRVLVGADGVNSVVSRSLGLRPQRKDLHRHGLGMESDIYLGEDRVVEVCNGRPDVLHILPTEGRMSYGWVFPKRDHLAVGIAGPGVMMHPLRPVFDAFVRSLEKRFGVSMSVQFRRTGLLGADGIKGQNVDDRVILVGDAAGFVDPLMGEGIAYAMRSGQHAATVLIEALETDHLDREHLSAYQRLCVNDFGANFSMASWAGLHSGRFAVSLLTNASKLSFSSRILSGLARGEMGYSDIPAVIVRQLPRELPAILNQLAHIGKVHSTSVSQAVK
ncbi:MAG: NAD(P)/FAD-dependent oxidoreductase [Candidatus Thorarchaeota archaeon]|nr:NAD(P)/FAD-dependent oxidoreductase [Candidatus Thorarchaeota archaeon]